MRELTASEIDEVSGGIATFVFGGVAGFVSYAGLGWMTGQEFSWSGAAGSTALGAVTNGYSVVGGAAVTGAGAVARGAVATSRGTIAGAAVSGAVREEEEDS